MFASSRSTNSSYCKDTKLTSSRSTNSSWISTASSVHLIDEADALDFLLEGDEHESLRLELAMAKRALELEYELNQSLCQCHFTQEDASTTGSLSEGDSLNTLSSTMSFSESTEKNLWSLPPVAEGAKPQEVAIVVGHEVSENSWREVAASFQAGGVQVMRLQAGVAGDEVELARMAPRRFVCILGDNTVMRNAINGIMDREDRECVTLAMLPVERNVGLLHEMGIDTLKDGVDKVLGGCIRRIDVFEYHGLSEEKPTYFLDGAIYGSLVDEAQHTAKMQKFIGGKAASKLSRMALIAANTEHRFKIDLPEEEVPEEFRQHVSEPQGYRGFCMHNGHQCCGFDTVTSSKADDGRFELCMMVRRTRQEFTQMWKQVMDNGAFPAEELSTTSQVRWASVTSMTAIPENGKSESLVVDGDNLAGSAFRIAVADMQLRIFA